MIIKPWRERIEADANLGQQLGAMQAQIDELEAALAMAVRDAERWRAGVRLYFPEWCGQEDSAPKGCGWFHQMLQDRWFDTPEEAIDAAISSE